MWEPIVDCRATLRGRGGLVFPLRTSNTPSDDLMHHTLDPTHQPRRAHPATFALNRQVSSTNSSSSEHRSVRTNLLSDQDQSPAAATEPPWSPSGQLWLEDKYPIESQCIWVVGHLNGCTVFRK
jgi:hypothetical protein